jgi:Sigma-70 region 2
VQEAFAQAIKKRASFKREAALEAWVWRIVINEALALRRRRAPEYQASTSNGTASTTPDKATSPPSLGSTPTSSTSASSALPARTTTTLPPTSWPGKSWSSRPTTPSSAARSGRRRFRSSRTTPVAVLVELGFVLVPGQGVLRVDHEARRRRRALPPSAPRDDKGPDEPRACSYRRSGLGRLGGAPSGTDHIADHMACSHRARASSSMRKPAVSSGF